MKKPFTLLAAVCISTALFGQASDVTKGIQTASGITVDGDKRWMCSGVAGLNMSQASFSNWTAGGDASIAFDAMFNYTANYKNGKHLWLNRLELAYGLNNTQSNGLRKTNDKIYLSSDYGYAVAKHLYVGVFLDFKTQFYKGYDYVKDPQAESYISKFMAPGYLTFGPGILWTPKSWFRLAYSPVAWRGTFVLDQGLYRDGITKVYGVEKGKKLLNQLGSDLMLEVNTPLWKNIGLYSRLDLYSNYLDKPQNIIVHWDTQITMKVNKWISANLSLNMIYDDNAIARMQVKQVLGVGFQATF